MVYSILYARNYISELYPFFYRNSHILYEIICRILNRLFLLKHKYGYSMCKNKSIWNGGRGGTRIREIEMERIERRTARSPLSNNI